MCVFVLYSPGESREICTDAVEHNVERVTHTHTHTHTHTRASCTHGSCHTYEWVMSHTWMSHVTHVKCSHINRRRFARCWMSHATHTHWSCHTYQWTMPESCPTQARTRPKSTHAATLCHKHWWIMSHILMNHMCHMIHQYLWHEYLRHDSLVFVTWFISICDMSICDMIHQYLWVMLTHVTHTYNRPHILITESNPTEVRMRPIRVLTRAAKLNI